MGALIDALGGLALGVALAERDHHPCQLVAFVGESKDKPKRRGRRTLNVERDVELSTARQLCLVTAFRLAPLPFERNPTAFDFFAGTLSLQASGSVLVVALDLFLPGRRAELDGHWQFWSRAGHAPHNKRPRKTKPPNA